MSRLRGLSIDRVLNGVRMLAQGRPRCLNLVRSLVRDRRGIEIGGPSAVFSGRLYLPIYGGVQSLDNCDFSQNTTWASHTHSYQFSPRKASGQSYFVEASELSGIAASQYDFLLSSHCLEHLANPVKGLKAWQRVVKPGGHMVLVLPHYARTFDRLRTPTTLEHMMADYERNTGEDDLSHVEESYAAHRPNNAGNAVATDEEFRTLLMNNFSHRTMHHHVFDESNSRALLETVGLKVLAVEVRLPFHIILVAQTS